ncbi:hypothetical protein LPJ59_004761, partial [Coemansia sp. RSA 2399]
MTPEHGLSDNDQCKCSVAVEPKELVFLTADNSEKAETHNEISVLLSTPTSTPGVTFCFVNGLPAQERVPELVDCVLSFLEENGVEQVVVPAAADLTGVKNSDRLWVRTFGSEGLQTDTESTLELPSDANTSDVFLSALDTILCVSQFKSTRLLVHGDKRPIGSSYREKVVFGQDYVDEADTSVEKAMSMTPAHASVSVGPDGLTSEEQLYQETIRQLQKTYAKKIKPLEQSYCFEGFHSAPLTPQDIGSKPMVLLVGQYSTGKTTFVEYLLGESYPGAHVGIEPTTDRFVAIMNGPEPKIIPGHAAAVSGDLPFSGLTKFGTKFLSRFQVAQLNNPLLSNLTLIDTPGILSGSKQINRGYDFISVINWFAERSDLILLLFDGYKLDISDEFKGAIHSLRGHEDKVRIVLNKCDQISQQQLMRIYGALMWSLGKVITTPEVNRVYLGSFWPKYKTP